MNDQMARLKFKMSPLLYHADSALTLYGLILLKNYPIDKNYGLDGN